MQKKAQAIQKQNTATHVLSRGGYEYLEKKLMDEKTKKKLEEAAQSRSTNTVIDPPSPIRWHVKWKMARTKKIGQMTSEVVNEIVDKIVSHFQLIIIIIYVYCVVDWTNKCVLYRIHWKSKRHRVPLSPMDVRISGLLPLGDQNTLVVCVLLDPVWQSSNTLE